MKNTIKTLVISGIAFGLGLAIGLCGMFDAEEKKTNEMSTQYERQINNLQNTADALASGQLDEQNYMGMYK